MKVHTTNYTNTFIEVAEDCPTKTAEMPPVKGDEKSIANMQFDLLYENPYKYDSDDVIFQCFANKQKLTKNELADGRKQFFSKGQPCMRSSPLTKRYGWGIHSDKDGKIAMYAMESKEYKKMASDKNLKVIKAMRSKRA